MSIFNQYHLSNDAFIQTELPGPKSRILIEKQKEQEGHGVSYPKSMPIAIKRAKGAIIEDVDGNMFIDFFAGCGVLNVGHSNPDVLAAVQQQQSALIHSLDFPTENKCEFVENILNELPESIRGNYKLMFCASTGADAIEAGIKLAKLKTGRDGIIAFQGGYHGVTAGALSITSYQKHHGSISSSVSGVHFIPYGYCYRCPFKANPESCRLDCVEYLRNILENPYSGVPKPAAIIIEPIQGEGGTIVPKSGYLERLTKIAHDKGIVVIFDEIQCGFYRSGSFLEFLNSDAIPDVITLSKGLGGIGMPLSAILYKKEMDVWVPGYHVGTFRGNQASIAAGKAALSFIAKHNLSDHIQEMGAYILKELNALAQEYQIIGDVRGKGLFIGIEFVKERNTKIPFPEYVAELRKTCFQMGLLFEVGGHFDNVVRFIPPLIIDKVIIDNALAIFKGAMVKVHEKLRCNENVI